ncbi:MAG: glycoside hydrolase family 19 protein, partial [Minisyncoccia bacterium]
EKSYFGRGFVQITHKRNYARVGEVLGLGRELIENPDLALDRERAIRILIEGSVQGLFSKDKKTGRPRKLSTYLNEQTTDWVGARGIINPGSKRAHIPAEHAQKFFVCLTN